MKTITEFLASTLKNALKTRQELTAAGKTAEELPAALGEALKLEGDKLTVLLSALEVVEKKTNDLKRVVVWTVAEGEVAPKGLEKKGDHYFNVEFFPPMPGQERQGRGDGRSEGRGKDRGRGDKRGGRGGGKDRDSRGGGGGRDDRGGRGPGGGGGRPPRDGVRAGASEGERRPRAAIVVTSTTGEGSPTPSEGSQDQKRHAKDRPRRPRKPREPEAPHVTPPPSASPQKVIQPRATPLAPTTETQAPETASPSNESSS